MAAVKDDGTRLDTEAPKKESGEWRCSDRPQVQPRQVHASFQEYECPAQSARNKFFPQAKPADPKPDLSADAVHASTR